MHVRRHGGGVMAGLCLSDRITFITTDDQVNRGHCLPRITRQSIKNQRARAPSPSDLCPPVVAVRARPWVCYKTKAIQAYSSSSWVGGASGETG